MRRSQLVSIALGLAALAWATHAALDQWWTADDAFISFRYARNLVDGLGLVFNAGERVEGFTRTTNERGVVWETAGRQPPPREELPPPAAERLPRIAVRQRARH